MLKLLQARKYKKLQFVNWLTEYTTTNKQKMESVIFICKLHSNTSDVAPMVCIEVRIGSSFTDIIEKVFQTWPHLNIPELDLTYSIPRYENCRLHNEVDVACLFRLVDSFSLKVVDIEVSSRTIVHETSVCSTSETSVVTTETRFLEYPDPNRKVKMGEHWARYLNGVGQKFYGGVDEFRSVLKKFCVECGYNYRLVRNHKKSVKAVCLGKGTRGEERFDCGWFITASVEPSTKAFVIRKWNNIHDCDLEVVTEKGKNLPIKIISQLIENKVRERPTITAADIMDHMFDDYGYTTTYKKAYKALLMARDKVLGNDDKSYLDLRWYIAVALSQNPGSSIVLEVDEKTNKFQRLFVAFGACIRGFAFIRPMLFIDGTHLSGKYLGTLLCATAKNGNQGLYPLAFAIVDAETVDNWAWFLDQLRNILKGDERRISFFSDRNLGLLNVVPRIFPEHDHYFCIHHMKENLKVKFSGVLSSKKDNVLKLFSLCAYAATVPLFNKYMSYLIQEGGQTIKDFLQGVPEKNWSKAFSVGCRFGEMTTNAVESFNSWVLDCRGMPIVQCVEGIRKKLMKWHHERKLKSAQWTTVLCKRIGDKICDRYEEVRTWGVTRCSATCFEVRTDYSFFINIEGRFCTCGRWQIDKFPCDHALACFLRTKELDIHMYIDTYFFTTEYRNAYEEAIYPVPSSLKEEFEPIGLPLVLPPSTKRPPGRPARKRKLSQHEIHQKKKRRKFTCSRCHKEGHSKKTCTETLA